MRRPRFRRPARPSCTASARSSRSRATPASAPTACGAYSTGPTGTLARLGRRPDRRPAATTAPSSPDLVSQAGRWYEGVAAHGHQLRRRLHHRPGRRLVGRSASRGAGVGRARHDVQRDRGAYRDACALAERQPARASARPTAPTCTSPVSRSTRPRRTAACSWRASRRPARSAPSARAASPSPGSPAATTPARPSSSRATNIIVGGSANLAGKAAFGLARFERDRQLGRRRSAPAATTATPIGTPAINGYITGMARERGQLRRSSRAGRHDPAGLATIAARYFATGAPAPPPPLPAASTQRRRPDHDDLRSRQRHGQHDRHRQHLVDRVRHDDRLRVADGRAAARRLERRHRRWQP